MSVLPPTPPNSHDIQVPWRGNRLGEKLFKEVLGENEIIGLDPGPRMIGVFPRGGNLDRYRGEDGHCGPRRKASEETNPADSLTIDLQPPEL